MTSRGSNKIGPFSILSLYVTSFLIVSGQERGLEPKNVPVIGSNETILSTNRSARRSVASGGIFTIVTFDNVPCNATTGDVGVCFTQRECDNNNGVGNGKCAGNYGVCCVLTLTCGATSGINNTYFVNPSNPAQDPGPLICSITINKAATAAQFYLEFVDFQIRGPTEGTCANDTFTVSVVGMTATYPILCGNNVGQSEYIGVSGSATAVTLTFVLAPGMDGRSWKIRIVQLKPGDACSAPGGCLQYYSGSSGTLTSFNYNSGMGEFLNNYCMNVCFHLLSGYCSLLLTENNFMLSGIAPSDCAGDYILANGQQFCGDTLNNGMLQVNKTGTGQFLSITVCADNENSDMDVGFSLNYQLVPC